MDDWLFPRDSVCPPNDDDDEDESILFMRCNLAEAVVFLSLCG